MKSILTLVLVFGLQSAVQAVSASDSASELDILAKRGKGVVTQEEFEARASRIPDNYRLEILRDRNRFRDILNGLLLNSQLTADAREAGFEKNELVINRMKLAAETELASAWLQHYIASQPPADFEALAREYYLLHEGEFLGEKKIDVSHILVSTKDRTDEDALALANDIHQQLIADPGLFDELVLKYSQDPSAASNHGSFKAVKKGDMVKPFEEVAFELQPGEISGPVRTQYGYHIIRLDAHLPPETLDFEAVKVQLIESERSKHEERIRRDYLETLSSLDVQMTEEQMSEMVRRQFGDKTDDQEAKGANSE